MTPTPDPARNRIVSFSGGQTSGRMLRILMDDDRRFNDNYLVVFCNTGREHNATLDFVHEVETRWCVPVVWLEYCREHDDHSFRVVDYASAARVGRRGPFDEMLAWAGVLPNVRGRGCSGQLKVRTVRRYLHSIRLSDWHSYIGIRSDEAFRSLDIEAGCPQYITLHFPLIERGITRADVDAWWTSQPFRLNIPNHLGNCDLCFLKAKWKRISILREHPEVADWWGGWEREFARRGVTGDGARWQAGKSVEGLLALAQHPEFALQDPNDTDVPCSCAVGGMREAGESEP